MPAPNALQAAALRALGRLSLLSQRLSARAVHAAEAVARGVANGSGGAEAQEAAVAVLADAISAFPNTYSDRLLLIGGLLVPGSVPRRNGTACGATSAESAGGAPAVPVNVQAAAAPPAHGPPLQQQERLAQTAAHAYCQLLLHNTLKLQGMLGPLGCTLVRGAPPVAAVVGHALRLRLGPAPPKDRARLAMALFHQAPLSCRRQVAEALADPVAGLLAASDLRGDVLVNQALQALLAAAGDASQGGEARAAAVAAAAALLRAMQPSAKVLAALHQQIAAGGGAGGGSGLLAKLPAEAHQALQALVRSHHPTAAGRQTEADAAGGDAEADAAGKRKRAGDGGKGGSAALQQQLLGVLGGGDGGFMPAVAGRAFRPTTSSAAAATSAAATSSRPAASSRGGASASRVASRRLRSTCTIVSSGSEG